MMHDENQIKKTHMRKELFNNLFIDPSSDLDSRSIDYFLDLVEEISLTKALANGEIDLNSFEPEDTRLLNRMYRVGSILNREEKTSEQIKFVHDYIDSCCVEFGKNYYEIGLLAFKNKVNEVVNTLFEKVDFYDAIIGISNSLDSIIETNHKELNSSKKTIQ